jgi:hypothetical protein
LLLQQMGLRADCVVQLFAALFVIWACARFFNIKESAFMKIAAT